MGEYVSVSSQANTERAELARERRELATTPESERAELAALGAEVSAAPQAPCIRSRTSIEGLGQIETLASEK